MTTPGSLFNSSAYSSLTDVYKRQVIYSTVQIQDLNLQKGDYDKILEFNKLIKQNCNRLIRLINNFIDSTKLENNKVEIHKKRVNIVSIRCV